MSVEVVTIGSFRSFSNIMSVKQVQQNCIPEHYCH